MSQETTDAGFQGDWRALAAMVEANSDELAYLEPLRLQLAAQSDKALAIFQQQSSLKAAKQEQSKQLRATITEGNRLSTLLRSAIKQHYGIRTEKVAEFGVQPFRGRVRRTKAEIAAANAAAAAAAVAAAVK
ncbi:MAG: hypothetical protein ACREMY_05120 [bacterium]